MLPSTARGQRLFLQYGPDYSFGRPSPSGSYHAGQDGNDKSGRQHAHEREQRSSSDSQPMARRPTSRSRSPQALDGLARSKGNTHHTSSYPHAKASEQQQDMAVRSSTQLALNQRHQARNGPKSTARQIRRTKSVDNLRVAHTNAQQLAILPATVPLPSTSSPPSVPAVHKSRSGPLRETMRRVFGRSEHASTANSPQSSRLALIRPRGLYSSSRTSRSSPRLSVVQEAADPYHGSVKTHRRNHFASPSNRQTASGDPSAPPSAPTELQGVPAIAQHTATPLWAASDQIGSRPDISTRSAQDLHDWFQAASAFTEFGPPIATSARSSNKSPLARSTDGQTGVSVPRHSSSAGSGTSFQSTNPSEPALPPPVRDPRRQPQDTTRPSPRHHQYHTSSLLAEAGSPLIESSSSPRLRHQVSLPRAAMELTSLIARVTQLEEQMMLVEQTQAKSKRQLNKIEGHLDKLVREGQTRRNAQHSRGRRPPQTLERRRIPTPDTWLRGNSSASSVTESSSPRTPPAAEADNPSSHDLSNQNDADAQTASQAKLLRESLLHQGYDMSLLKVFAAVNDEHDARMTLQEDVAYIRCAIESMKQSLPRDMVRQSSPDPARPVRPAEHGPSGTPFTNMGSRFSTDSSENEAEPSTSDPLPNRSNAQSAQLNVGLGLTARSSADHAGQEVFSTPPLHQSPPIGEGRPSHNDRATGR